MATTLDTLVARTRRFVRDYPTALDALTASLSNSATTVAVNAGTQFNASGNQVIELDYEAILTASVTSNNITVRQRGYAGSTAVSHASSAAVLIAPSFYAVEIIDALNSAKDEMYPQVYRPILDTSLAGITDTYEYTVPNMTGTYGGDTIPIQFISRVEIKESGDTAYREERSWTIRRAATPKIKFRRAPTSGCTIRVHGFGPFPDWSASGDTVDALFPKNAERALVLGAASRLLASGEAGRVRADTGARDDREAANRVGSSMNAANDLYRRFQLALRQAQMQPLPPHVVSVI